MVGQRFGFAFVQSLGGWDEATLLDAIKELIAAGLAVEESAEDFSFQHALTREAVYADLLARERRTLHRQVAELIERLHGDEPDALDDHLDLAYHYSEAALWDKALDYGLRAGQRALALYAPRTAVELLSRALSAAAQLDVSAPAQLRHARGQAHHQLGDFEAARNDLEHVVEVARAEGDELLAWRALLDLAVLWAGRDSQRAGSYVREALAAARRMDNRVSIADSLNRLGDWHANAQATDASLDCHRQALAIFEELGDARGVAETLNLLGLTSQQAADPLRAADYLDGAIALLRELDDRQRLVDAMVLRTALGGGYTLDRVAPSTASTLEPEAGLRLAREIGWRAGEAFAAWQLALWRGPRGEYDRHWSSPPCTPYRRGDRAPPVHGGRALRIERNPPGRTGARRARAHAEEALRLSHEISSPVWIDISAALLASIAVALRDLDTASSSLGQVLDSESHVRTIGQRLAAYARVELLLVQHMPRPPWRCSSSCAAHRASASRRGASSCAARR